MLNLLRPILLAIPVSLLITLALVRVCPAQAYFMWVPGADVDKHRGYSKVIGGQLDDGTPLPICRSLVGGYPVPGKYYNRNCIVPWNGKEVLNSRSYDFLISRISLEWKPVHNLSRAQIENAVVAADGQANTGRQFFCRMRMKDGIHPGKYAIGNGLCYIPWGGKEYSFTDGFDILFVVSVSIFK